MHFGLATCRIWLTILISTVFRDTVFIRGEALIMLTPKSAGLIRGWRLFETRHLLKEIQL